LIQIRTAANWGDEGALKNFPYAEFNGCHGPLVAAAVVVRRCCADGHFADLEFGFAALVLSS
jgi:hypothetical protein